MNNIPEEHMVEQIEQEYDPTDEFIAFMEDLAAQNERELERIADWGFESEVI